MNEDAYLADWQSILQDRVSQVIEKFSHVEGVAALIVGGSLGGGQPWPLSDIDIIPIYGGDRPDETNERLKHIRAEMITAWEEEGWRTALDMGTLYFHIEQVRDIISSQEVGQIERLFENMSVYHCLDKAYRGRAAFDPEGYADRLIQWFNRHRFNTEVIAVRLNRRQCLFSESIGQLGMSISNGQFLASTYYLNEAVEHLRSYLLECWGERDNSFARLGTRFDKLAFMKNKHHIVRSFNHLKTLDDHSVMQRLQRAPDWVRKRHRLSYKCRRFMGEAVTELQDARDILRVFARYEMRSLWNESVGPYPEWLCITGDKQELQRKHELLVELSGEIFADV